MVSLIVVDYNSINKTIQYILHANRQIVGCEAIHNIIIDNGSVDSLDALRCRSTDVRRTSVNGMNVQVFTIDGIEIVYYFANCNLGYAKGNNIGIKLAIDLFGDSYCIVSNNDLELTETIDWSIISRIFELDPAIGVIGPGIINPSGCRQSPNKRMDPFRTLILDYLVFKPFKKQTDLDYSNESKYCYRVSGCFMIINTSIMEEIGFFDEGTFLYCEEMILSERLLRKGYKTYYCNDLTLLHNHGKTIGSYASFYRSERWMHNSYMYYFENYRNISRFLLNISELVFNLYLVRRGITSAFYKLLDKFVQLHRSNN